MAMEKSNSTRMIDRTDVASVADVRDVPLEQLSGDADARKLVDWVMASADGPGMVVVSNFNSSI
jgi:hypothetical protein